MSLIWRSRLKCSAMAALVLSAALLCVASAQENRARSDTKPYPPACAAAHFKKHQLTNEFWSEGAAFSDINRDGFKDIVAGPYWYEGPDFKKRHEFRPASSVVFTTSTVTPTDGRPPDQRRWSDSFLFFIYDFNGDGWPDILLINWPGKDAAWYENPGKDGLSSGAAWKRHVAFDVVGDESSTFGDLLGTGKPVLMFVAGGYLGYATPDWKNPEEKWSFHTVSAKGTVPDNPYIHGLGFGDVNGDGRNDLLTAAGWWEQPLSIVGDPIWRFHPFRFGDDAEHPFEGGAQMYVYDVNGDGRPDIISSLQAHGYGLAWFEQLKERTVEDEIQFKKHIIIGKSPSENPYGVTFSQMHAQALVDIDGDGLKDIVTGKRFWAHGRYKDEDPGGPAVLYWFKLVREAGGGAEFIPCLIDNDSGVGTQVTAGDVNGAGRPDIVVANKKGAFVFLQTARGAAQK